MKRQEEDAQFSYDQRKQALLSQVSNDEDEETVTKKRESEAEYIKSTSEGDLHVAEDGLAKGQESLETLINGCRTAANDYVTAQASREEELKALRDAKDTLESSTKAAKEATYGDESAESESFIQLRSSITQRGSQVVTVLQKLARKQGSDSLAQLASRIGALMRFGASTGEDPFEKVKGMIAGMIKKLQDEAGAEATKKEWCETQKAETGTKKDKLELAVNGVSSKIDKAKADSVTLKEQVAETMNQLVELSKMQKTMDQVRQEEHVAFVKSKSDLEQGLNGVRMAKQVLRNYYASQEEALLQSSATVASFLQTGSTLLPIRPSHVKAQAAGTDIVQMLDVVESDFGKNLALTNSQEENAVQEYKTQSEENKLDKLQLQGEVEFKTQQAKSVDKRVAEYISQRENSQTELDAVLEYAEGVRENCDVKPESYEERKARRQEEIDGLNQALATLRGEAFLQNHKGGRHGLRGSATFS